MMKFDIVLKDGSNIPTTKLNWDFKGGSREIIYLVATVNDEQMIEIPYSSVNYIIHTLTKKEEDTNGNKTE